MRRSHSTTFARALAALGLAALGATSALAGPPLVCWRVETGGARSLNWNEGAGGFDGARPGYPMERLVDDTLALLQPDVPVIVRVETLRIAALYASKGPQIAERPLSRVIARRKESG